VSLTAGKIATGLKTAEAQSAVAPPDQARSPAAGTHSPRKHRRIGSASRGRRAPGTSANPVSDDLVVIDLVTRARSGDKQAWDALVERAS